jgi:hypothetical protein
MYELLFKEFVFQLRKQLANSNKKRVSQRKPSFNFSGEDGTRTHDLLTASQTL